MTPQPPAGGRPRTAPASGPRRDAVIGAVLAGGFLLVAAPLAALALSRPGPVDLADVEQQIQTLARVEAGLDAVDVRCPEVPQVGAGESFRCTARLDGQPVSYTVSRTGVDGDVRVTPDDAVVRLTTVEAAVTAQVEDATGTQVLATCDGGDRTVLVGGDGVEVPCAVTAVTDRTMRTPGTARVDETGRVRWIPD